MGFTSRLKAKKEKSEIIMGDFNYLTLGILHRLVCFGTFSLYPDKNSQRKENNNYDLKNRLYNFSSFKADTGHLQFSCNDREAVYLAELPMATGNYTLPLINRINYPAVYFSILLAFHSHTAERQHFLSSRIFSHNVPAVCDVFLRPIRKNAKHF
jgi:hypothetical protein